MLKNKQMHKN